MHYRREVRALRVYFAATALFDPSRAVAPGRTARPESAAAWSLLLWALRRDFGAQTLPDIAVNAAGKPYFPAEPELRFSLSHTRGCVLCALSDTGEVGADVQVILPKDEPFAARLMSERERADFTLHELWCLREAVYKLTGSGSLRSMPFRREGGRIVSPFDGVECRLYGGIPGCEAAVAAFPPEPLPDRIEEVGVCELQKGIVITPGS